MHAYYLIDRKHPRQQQFEKRLIDATSEAEWLPCSGKNKEILKPVRLN
jgi:hypothetical protein